MQDFQSRYGPWALVVGASEGLGAAFAEALAQRGLHLILIARRLPQLEALAASLRQKYPVEVRVLAADLSDGATVMKCLSEADIQTGLLVYNAAYAPIGYFEDLSLDALQQVVAVNVVGPLLLSRMVAGKMLARGSGGIVLMSSMAGVQGSPKIAAYAASKAFNTILAEGLWAELRSKGIDVVASCAGAIRTPGYLRAGSAREAPGTLDAATVAEETLNALRNGPVVVPGRTNKLFRFLMGRLLPRKLAIAIMASNTKTLST